MSTEILKGFLSISESANDKTMEPGTSNSNNNDEPGSLNSTPKSTISKGKNCVTGSSKGKSLCRKSDSSLSHKSTDDNKRLKSLETNLVEIQKTLKGLTDIIPFVSQLKTAYEEDNESNLEEITPESLNTEDNSDTQLSRNVTINDELSYFKEVTGQIKVDGPVINDDIAQGVNNLLCSGLDKEKRKNIGDKYQTPGNCERLNTIPCNPEIFKKVSPECRERDKFLQSIQTCLIKGLCAQTYAFDKTINLLKKTEDKDISDLLNIQSDATTLLAQSSHMIDLFRRQNFKPEIRDVYSSLCSDNYPISKFLFGPELGEKIKDVSETLKVSNRLNRGENRFKPFFKRKFPFLGRNPFPNKRGGGSRNTQYNHQSNKKQIKFRRQRQRSNFN